MSCIKYFRLVQKIISVMLGVGVLTYIKNKQAQDCWAATGDLTPQWMSMGVYPNGTDYVNITKSRSAEPIQLIHGNQMEYMKLYTNVTGNFVEIISWYVFVSWIALIFQCFRTFCRIKNKVL